MDVSRGTDGCKSKYRWILVKVQMDPGRGTDGSRSRYGWIQVKVRMDAGRVANRCLLTFTSLQPSNQLKFAGFRSNLPP
jgi:hypothetical protein